MLQLRKNNIIYDPIDVLKGNASIKLVVTPTQEKIRYWKLFSVKCGKDNSYSTWYHNSDDMTIFQNYAEPKRLIKRQLSSHKTLFACSRDYVGKKFVSFNINVEPWWLFNLKKYVLYPYITQIYYNSLVMILSTKTLKIYQTFH